MVSVGFMPFKRYLREFGIMFESVFIHFIEEMVDSPPVTWKLMLQ